MTGAQARMPIFINGMLPRSGTNHLWDLLGLHPDTKLMGPVYEDHIIKWSRHLLHYVDDVSRHWSDTWNVPADESSALLRALGDGILAWVAGDSPQRVVTKMPSVENVEHFYSLFPHECPLLILVRDGRSLCESAVTTFGWTYERAFRRWRRSADEVLRLFDSGDTEQRKLLVKYEDLIIRPAEVMRTACQVTGLDPETYPYDQIERLPVRGSSILKSEGGQMHWAPTEHSASFSPLERWQTWSPHLHRRFERVAGQQQLALGYGLVEAPGDDTVIERYTDVRDNIFDARYDELRIVAGRVRRAVLRNTIGV